VVKYNATPAKKLVETPHYCFVQVKSTLKKNKDWKIYIYFDFECTQENGTYTPNLCVAEGTGIYSRQSMGTQV
jgi:hypothetical protein